MAIFEGTETLQNKLSSYSRSFNKCMIESNGTWYFSAKISDGLGGYTYELYKTTDFNTITACGLSYEYLVLNFTCLAKDSSGNIYMLIRVESKSKSEIWKYDGSSFTQMTEIEAPNYIVSDTYATQAYMVIDSNDDIHLLYAGFVQYYTAGWTFDSNVGYEAYHRYLDVSTSTWYDEQISTGTTGFCNIESAVIDSSDNIHIIIRHSSSAISYPGFYGIAATSLQYNVGTFGSWSSWETLQTDNISHADMVVDSSDNIWIGSLYKDGVKIFNGSYGSWSSEDIHTWDMDGEPFYDVYISLCSNGLEIHAFWDRYYYTDDYYYQYDYAYYGVGGDYSWTLVDMGNGLYTYFSSEGALYVTNSNIVCLMNYNDDNVAAFYTFSAYRLKKYVGGIWVGYPLKKYLSGSWTTKPLKNYDGGWVG